MPIVSEAELMAAVTRDRASGRRIGFVAVAFDLLRVGHVRLLQAAASKSDRLVVALLDDAGKHVVAVRDRAELVDNLRGVDYVIVTPSDRIDALAALIAPDVRS